MTIGAGLAPVGRFALPEPMDGFLPADGGDQIVYFGASGRVWCLNFGAGIEPAIRATGIVVPQPRPDDFTPLDFAADRLVIFYDEHLHVFNLSTGEALLRVRFMNTFGACLTPDGRHLIWFDEGETRVWSLIGSQSVPHVTNIFHHASIDKTLFGCEPESAARVTPPGSVDRFHVIVGHYGFAVEYSVIYKPATPAVMRLAAPPRVHADFCLDPVEVIAGNRYPLVGMVGGYCSEFKLLDVETGCIRACPDLPKQSGRGCGNYVGARPIDRNRLIVMTSVGSLMWDLVTNDLIPLCADPLIPLRFGEGHLWTWNPDEPTTLWVFASAVGALE
jgi:hypothetical protein